MLHRPINAEPLMAVLGIIVSSIMKNNMERDMVSFVSRLAQGYMLLSWKQKSAPTYSNLMTDVMKHYGAGENKIVVEKSGGKFYQIQPHLLIT